MSKSWPPYALHILDAIEHSRNIQARGDLAHDQVLYDAAPRNPQTLSEATRHFPDDLKATNRDIPWREISGFRNILVHNYLGDIDSSTVTAVIAQQGADFHVGCGNPKTSQRLSLTGKTI